MLEELSRERHPLERWGLRTESGRAAPVIRAMLALVKEAPVVGWAVKGMDEARKNLLDEDNDSVLEEKFAQLFASGQQTHDQLAFLTALSAAIYQQNAALGEALAREHVTAEPERIAGFARETALQAYRGRVAREHQFVDHRGIEGGARRERASSLPFDDVYVTPRLVAERERAPVQERARDLLHQLTRRRDDLGEGEVAKLEMEYLELTGAPWRSGPKAEEGGEVLGEALAGTRHAVVIGSPGVGKSALSRFLSRVCALGGDAVRERLGWEEELLPLLVPLAVFADARRESRKLSLRQFVRERMRERGGEALAAAVDDELAAGRVFVLLDGVDEIPEAAERVAVVRAVEEFMTDLGANRFLVTSRPFGYERLKGDIAHFQLPNFTPQQVDEFVHKRQRAIERQQHGDAADMDRAEADARALLEEIRRNPRVTELASNPLMLVIVSIIRYEHARLPQERVQLYERAVKTLMDTWNYCRSEVGREIGGTTLSTDRLIRVWGAVAEWTRRTTNTGVMHRAELKRKLVEILTEREYDEDDPEATAESYLRAITEKAGLLEERGPGIFAFWHPTFEEFLAAVELATPSHRAARRLLEVCDDPRWREVVLLAVGYIGIVQKDPDSATEIVQCLLDTDLPPTDAFLHSRLRLVAGCVADDVGVKKKLKERVISELAKVVQAQPYELLAGTFVETVRALPALKLSADAVQSVVPLSRHPRRNVRMEAARLLSNVAAEIPIARDACERLLSDDYSDVRCYAALGLARSGWYDAPVWWALSNFSSFLAHVGPAWLEFLRAAPPNAVEALLSLVDEGADADRLRALDLLREMGKEEGRVVEGLLGLLVSEDGLLRLEAAGLLLQIGKEEGRVVEVLLDLLGSEDGMLRLQAANLLLEMGKAEGRVVEVLLGLLESEDGRLRVEATDVLLEIGKEEGRVVEVLLGLLGSDDGRLRFEAADLLLEMGKEEKRASEVLLGLLGSDDGRLRLRAANWLRAMGKEEGRVVQVLLGLLGSGDGMLRLQAANQLRAMGKEEGRVVEVLLGLLGSEDGRLRFQAANWLREIGKEAGQVLEVQLGLLRSELRSIAVYQIGLMVASDFRAVEKVVQYLPAEPEVTPKVLIIARMLWNGGALTLEDSAAVGDLVRVDEGDSPDQAAAREVLFNWFRARLEPS